MITEEEIKKLMSLLDEAVLLSGEFRGGANLKFDNAEAFHEALKKSVIRFQEGYISEHKNLYLWFGPTCSWDTFIGIDGKDLANEILALLEKMIQK